MIQSRDTWYKILRMSQLFTPAVVAVQPPSAPAHFFVCLPEGLLIREAGQAVQLPALETVTALGLSLAEAHYLGRLGEKDCFALSLPAGSELPPSMAVRSLRKLYGTLDEDLFAIAGRAIQITFWAQTHRFCGRCATPLVRQPHERAMRCPACALTAFPRLSPAVIVLVRRGAQALLGRSARFPLPMYSTLAGFVEPGESLEETVRREIFEEVGIQVKNLRYFGSQPWPFPHSLMIGFMAEYESGELHADGEEIIDARFFDADQLPQIPPPLSIARQLINAWLAEQGQLR
jgi:NAD+ diphosphatase